jgi:predicted transcriptional regulator
MGRHRLPETHQSYQIEQMWDVHHEIVRLALIGMKHVDIAGHLGVSPVMVSYTLRSPIVKEQLKNMQSARDLDAVDISQEIRALAPAAVKVLEELMESDLPNIKLKSAQDILDRAGFAPIRMIQTANVHAHLTKDDIIDIKNRAKEIGLMMDPYIDMEEADAGSYEKR